MELPWIILTGALALCVLCLLFRLLVLRRSIREVAEELEEKLQTDIGGHGKQDVALLDGIPLLELSFLNGTLRHGQAQLGHQYSGCHRNTSFP